MAFTDESGAGMVMPVSPMYGNGMGNGFGFGGDSGWWIILLFILLGNNGWGGYGGGGTAPYMVDNSVQRGFDQSAVMNGITGIQSAVTSGFGDVQNALCGGFGQAEIAANTRQMANMNQLFGMQTAVTGGFTDIASQLASCCCENRLASADLKYTIATEACNDRSAVTNALEAVIANQTANTQRILDQMCNDKIDAKNAEILNLERQLAMANLAASQTAQTAEIISKLPAAAA